ncbi:PREDICTED: uncharacterized protein LOC107185288, partial [Dufourea novaeangliae]|uniref:uncharacterized protein LOC107185288 n=1 Tax=Dufourea novaeangliae TaxID=178035 RepID=UPI000767346B
ISEDRLPGKRQIFCRHGKLKRWKQVDKEAGNNVHTNIPKRSNNEVSRTLHNSVQLQIEETSKVQTPSNHEQCKKDMLKTIRQPIIVLSRIDNVINKIAQSLAKVISNKQSGTIEQATIKQDIAVTQTEKNVLPLKPTLLSVNGDDCIQDSKIDSLISNTSVEEDLQENERIQNNDTDKSTSSDMSYINFRRKRKFKSMFHDIFGDSSDSSNDTDDNIWKRTPKKTKRHKLSLRRERTVTADGRHNAFNKQRKRTAMSESINKNSSLQTNSSKKTSVSTTLYNLFNKAYIEDASKNVDANYEKQNVENKEVSGENEEVNVVSEDVGNEKGNIDVQNASINVHTEIADVAKCKLGVLENTLQESNESIESIEENCASNSVPLEVDSVQTTEHNICIKVEDTSSANEEEIVTETVEIQKQTIESPTSDTELIRKYKLFEELKVLVINLEHIKPLFGNKYSAMEIEQLHHRYKNFLLNSNFMCASSKSLSSNIVYAENIVAQHEKSDDCGIAKSSVDRLASSSDSCENQNSPIKSSASIKSYPNKKVTVQKARNLGDNNLFNSPTVTQDNSYQDERFKKISDGNVKENSVSLFSPKKSTKVSKLTNLIENNSPKKADVSCKDSLIESTCKILNSSSSTESFENRTTNVRSRISTKSEQSFASKSLETKSYSTGGYSSKNIEQILSPKKKSCGIMEQSKDASIDSHKADIHNFLISPITCQKTVEKKETNKCKEFFSGYKCIICDRCFENYSFLKQHLSKHMQKQSSISSHTSKLVGSVEKSPKPKIVQKKVSLPSVAKRTKPQQSSNEENTSQVVSTSITDEPALLRKEPRSKTTQAKQKNNVTRRRRVLKPSKLTTECSVCFREFPTRMDLAAHIFLHTERELKEAFEIARQKIIKGGNFNETKAKESELQKTNNSAVNNTTDVIEKSLENTDENKISRIESSIIQKQDEQLIVQSKATITDNVIVTDIFKSMKSVVYGENNTNSIQPFFIQSKIEKAKAIAPRKSFTVCQCHNRSDTNFSCLQIEIVLLCHTCRVLFRSIECFETHYRLPEYSVCNQNRPGNGRSPNLFCATCGMIFVSVQDVRHHLQIHVRFKQNCTMDFRCNVCKVMFIGIGSLFYIHWSKHTKDPFWVASEQSFPKISVISLKSKKKVAACKPGEFALDNLVDSYIYIAEYICSNCNTIFVNEEYLKIHNQICKPVYLAKSPNVQADVSVEKQLRLRMICSLCNGIFCDRLELYMHMKNKHKFASEPQFVCLSGIAGKSTYICNVCIGLTESIDEFNEHWLKHYTRQPQFTCMYCEKESNSLSTFLKHVTEHRSEMKDDTVSCKVTYQEVKLLCKLCGLGFEFQEDLSKHNAIHKTINQTRSTKTNIVANRMVSVLNPNTNNVSDLSNPTESTTEKHNRKPVLKNINTNIQGTEKKTEQCLKSSRDMDKEKLISILEGNEEGDSDNELIIDLKEQSELDSEPVVVDKCKKNTFASAATLSVPSAVCVPPVPERATPDVFIEESVIQTPLQKTATNLPVTVSIKDTVTSTTSQNDTHPEKTSGSHTTTNNIYHPQSTLSANEEKLEETTSIKQKYGFLRVKNLAELTGSMNTLHVCEVCKCTFESIDSMKEHLLNHTAETTRKNSYQDEIPANTLRLQQSTNCTGQKKLVILQTTLTNPRIVQAVKAIPISKPPSTHLRTSTSTKVVFTKPHIPVPASLPTYCRRLVPRGTLHKVATPCSPIQTNVEAPMEIVVNSSDGQTARTTSTTVYSNNEHSQTPVNSTMHLNITSSLDLPSETSSVNNSGNSVYRHGNYAEFNSQNSAGHLVQEPYNTGSMYKQQDTQGDITVNIGGSLATNRIMVTSSNQNYEPILQTNQSQVRIHPPRTGFYPNPDGSYLLKTAPSEQVTSNQMVTGDTSPFFYCADATNCGMSILINQTAPIVSSVSTVDIQQQQAHQELAYQPSLYNVPAVSSDPSMQQSQSGIDYSGSSDVYQVPSNDYGIPVRKNVTTCQVALQPTTELICPYCPNSISFVNQDLYELHISVSHNFICEVCNLSFYSIDELSIHRIKHEFI